MSAAEVSELEIVSTPILASLSPPSFGWFAKLEDSLLPNEFPWILTSFPFVKTKNKIDNKTHPIKPENADYDCPYCR